MRSALIPFSLSMHMKFTALRSERVALDGLRVTSFVEGHEYDVSDDHYAQLQLHEVAPTDKPKAAHPVTENKMINPVANNKGGQHGHQNNRR